LLAGFIFVKCQPCGNITNSLYIANIFLGKYLDMRGINNCKILALDHFVCYTESVAVGSDAHMATVESTGSVDRCRCLEV
jgi:hypothetical protein